MYPVILIITDKNNSQKTKLTEQQIVNIQTARFEFGKWCWRKRCLNGKLTAENKTHLEGRGEP